MIRSPSRTEWDTSRLSALGRAYLDNDLSFEEIVSRVIESATVISNRIKPYDDAPLAEEDGRQIIFVVRVAPEISDLLYNACDGMRGRYWQSPDHGFAATKHLISGLLRTLMLFAERHPPTPPKNCAPMGAEDIKVSLESISAKVWPREYDEDGNWLLKVDQLKVLRWEQNEGPGEKGPMWRQSPTTGDIEIKGALIRTVDQIECIPEGKRDRSCQLHRFGYT
jgi:hypothetical protein